MASELGAEKSRENSPWRWWNAGRANRGRPACASFPCIPYSLSRSSFLSLFLFPSLPPLFPLPRSLLFSYKRVYTCTLLFRTQASYGVPTNRALQRARTLSLSLFPSPLYLLALSLFTCLVSSPIARSIPSTEIHRDSFGILPFLSSPFPPFFFLFSFELSRLEKEKRNVSFISFLYPAIFDRESLAII